MFNKRKKLIIFLILAFVVSAGAGFVILKARNEISLENKAVVNVPEIQKVSILAFGDMMLDRNVFLKTREAGDFNFPFLKIDPMLRQADIKIANLEGPITNFESVSQGNNRMRFTVSPDFLSALKSRFQVLGLANNHMQDFGEEGYSQTKEFLASAGINYFGDFKNRKENLSTVIEKNRIKIGFVGYHALAEENLQDIVDAIKKLEIETDFVIVFSHWGAEYQDEPAIIQKKEARMFIDNGADLVLGSHPHVVQESEDYQGKKIFYSLGNFIFDQYFSEETMKGLAVKILIEKSDEKIEAKYDLLPIRINENSQPEPAE